MKILVLLPRFPRPLDKGDRLRAWHQLLGLAQRHEIFVCALSHAPVAEADRLALEEAGIGCEVELVPGARKGISGHHLVAFLARGKLLCRGSPSGRSRGRCLRKIWCS